MRRRNSQFALGLALAVLAGIAAEPVLAQRGLGQTKPKRPPQQNAVRPLSKGPGPGRLGRGAGPGAGANAPMPPRWIERLREMSPEEQERFLDNNERFRLLPPHRQDQIRQNLRHWNSLTSEQRQQIRARERVWEQLSPEERRRVREEILPKWQQLSPERRREMMWRLRSLRGLTEAEREARLNDAKFMQGLAPDEQNLLRDLVRFRVGPAAPAPGQAEGPPQK